MNQFWQKKHKGFGFAVVIIIMAVLIIIISGSCIGYVGEHQGSNYTGEMVGEDDGNNSCTNTSIPKSVFGLINQNKSIYQKAAAAEGIDWEMLAAIHYREGTNNPNSSLMSGETIGTKNPDNGQTYNSLLDSAIAAAKSLKSRVNGLKTNADDNTVKLAFLGHNRGNMYKNGGCSVDQSPYVMNQFDSAHQDMVWPNNSCEPKSTRGKTDSKLGSFTVYSILKGRITGNEYCFKIPEILSSTGDCTWKAVKSTGMNSAAANTKVTIRVWRLRGDQKVSEETNVYVNKFCTGKVRQIFEEIYNSPERPAINSVGCYADRNNDFSIHQYGAACDINSNENFCNNCYAKKSGGSCGTKSNIGSFWKPGNILPDKKYYGWTSGNSQLSIPVNGAIAKAFARAGWGRGLFHEQYGSCYNDFMHFSLYGGR